MATPILSLIDAPERLRSRTKLMHGKVVAGLDVGENWVMKHVNIWRSYVEKPANKLHDNVQRRTQRLDKTLKVVRDTVPHPFKAFKK